MILDYFDSAGNPVPIPPSGNYIRGNEGYISYIDTERPQTGKITIGVETFEQLKAYMDYLTASSRYKDVTWFPAHVPITPPKEI